ncbi:MAG TPA: hypothetical protein VM290_07675 [Gaiellaceae bacterium]|nr:hypothetical protein [Gaiellaceae bacterium]
MPSGLTAELEAAAAVAVGHAAPGEELEAVIAAEPGPGRRVYLCSYVGGGRRTWLALESDGRPLERRRDVREAVSIAALCELAAETAGGGALEELRAELAALRLRENPPGIEEAEEAALALERAVGGEPRLASPAYLDGVGAATRRLELALGQTSSPFAEAMKLSHGAVEELAADVEGGYKRALD